MKISEFKESYPDSTSLSTRNLLNQAVDKVLGDNQLTSEGDLTRDVLAGVYLAIARGEVEIDAEGLMLAAAEGGENFREMALRVIDRTREKI